MGELKRETLLAEPPQWLVAGQARQRARADRRVKGRLRRELEDALVESVHDAWFQELKRAAAAEVDGVDKRWALRAGQARQEAARLIDELTPERVHARINREQSAARSAAVYRAGQLARRAFGEGLNG